MGVQPEPNSSPVETDAAKKTDDQPKTGATADSDQHQFKDLSGPELLKAVGDLTKLVTLQHEELGKTRASMDKTNQLLEKSLPKEPPKHESPTLDGRAGEVTDSPIRGPRFNSGIIEQLHEWARNNCPIYDDLHILKMDEQKLQAARMSNPGEQRSLRDALEYNVDRDKLALKCSVAATATVAAGTALLGYAFAAHVAVMSPPAGIAVASMMTAFAGFVGNAAGQSVHNFIRQQILKSDERHDAAFNKGEEPHRIQFGTWYQGYVEAPKKKKEVQPVVVQNAPYTNTTGIGGTALTDIANPIRGVDTDSHSSDELRATGRS